MINNGTKEMPLHVLIW